MEQDEAFELWLTQWATAYEEGTPARQVIQDIHDTFFLVNIVDNNFTGDEGEGEGGEEGEAGGKDIFSVFRTVILRDMSGEELAAYTTETERENHHLHSVIKELRKANTTMGHEMKLLREALAISQKEIDALKVTVQAMKLQRGFPGPGNNGPLASARNPKPPTSASAATPASSGAAATPAAAFFPTA